MDLKGFAADHLGHFAPHDIGNGLFAMLVAALLGMLWARWGWRMNGAAARNLGVWGALAALALFLVRLQLPLAIGLLAVLLLLRGRGERTEGGLPLAGALVLGMGCGSGAALVMLAIAPLFMLLARWANAGGRAA